MDKDEQEEQIKKMSEIVEKYKDKPLLYKKLGRMRQRFKGCRTINQETHKELANLTAKINFRCYFENGKCVANRTEMCCCSTCNSSVGHFNTVFFKPFDNKQFIEEEMLYYAKKYRISTGFWRKGEGCILPRHKRSSTCLTYHCSNQLTNEEKLLINVIRNYEPHPPYIRGIIGMLKNYFLYRDE